MRQQLTQRHGVTEVDSVLFISVGTVLVGLGYAYGPRLGLSRWAGAGSGAVLFLILSLLLGTILALRDIPFRREILKELKEQEDAERRKRTENGVEKDLL